MILAELKLYCEIHELLLPFQMIEGSPPFSSTPEYEVPKAYVANQRPPFTASAKHYRYGLKE